MSTTHSVGQVQVGHLMASYFGTQRLTINHRGHDVYGGSTLVVSRGAFADLLRLDLQADVRTAVEQALVYHGAATTSFSGLFASRCNYDVAQGVDDSGRCHSGVLEQSWRIGGASGAEAAALHALRDDPACSVSAYRRARSTAPKEGRRRAPGSCSTVSTATSAGSPSTWRCRPMSTIEEAIEITVDASHIAGTFVTPGTLIPGVLFVHGWGGSQEQYLARARDVAALGCVCLTFDLRGHAQTRLQFETVSRADNLQDVLSAYDTLVRRRHVDPAAIAVVGSSYGGYLASILSSMRAVKWLALRAPALYIDSGWEVRSCNCTSPRTCGRTGSISSLPPTTAHCKHFMPSKATCC